MIARKQVAIWPSMPQAQTSRLSSVFFPFSVFQPILNCGLRMPAFRHIPLRRSIRPCGIIEPLCFAGAAQPAFLAPSGPLGHASPASSRQRSATLYGRHRSGWSDRPYLQVQANFGIQQRSWDFFPFAALILRCRAKRFWIASSPPAVG